MRNNRSRTILLPILLGLVSCNPSQFVTGRITASPTNQPTNTITTTQADLPILTPSPTFDPEDISRLNPTPTLIPGLHSAGPYLFLDSRPNLYGECNFDKNDKRYLYELNGSGRRDISFTEGIRGCFSPDMRWYAFLSAKLDDRGAFLLEKGIPLYILNRITGTITKVADIIPEDYVERQKGMVEEYLDAMKDSEISKNDWFRDSVDVNWGIMNIRDGFRHLDWSPDSRYLAFPAMIDGNSTDVYLLDMDTGILERKEKEYLNVSNIEWSPDSKQILFNNIEPLSSAPSITTSYWVVRADQSGPTRLLENQCGVFSWISEREFIGRNCNYGCGGDAPTGTDLFRINISSGVTRSIWKGDWYGYAFDKETGTIILNAEDPCSEEECNSDITGIYIGPIFGYKKRISDGRIFGYDFMFRKGSIHRFLGLSNPSYYPFTFVEGITNKGEAETLIQGNNLRVSLPTDYKWMAITGDHGISLFDDLDRLVFQWKEAPVHKAVWTTNSQTLFFMTSDAVFKMSTDSFSIQKVFDCPTGSCNGDTGLSLILDIYLPSLPNLRAQPPSFENRTQGTSLWSKLTFQDLLEPGIQEYSVDIPTYSSWRWDFSWCAKSQVGLEAILGPLNLEFLIGGEKIGEDIFRMYDSPKGGGFCRTWATMLSGWQPGDVTNLEIRYTLHEAINDGARVFPAGEYRQIIHIEVTG
jgi:hypothetical protein